ARKLALEPRVQIIRRSRRPLLRGLEQARRSALAHHVHRIAPMGPRVLISGTWYNRSVRAQSGPTETSADRAPSSRKHLLDPSLSVFDSGSMKTPRCEAHDQRERGSSASRRPSPTKLKARTARKIASPGQTAIQGALTRKRWAELSMLPHDGAGGCWPRPRKDRDASAMMAAAIESVACTSSAGRIFGKI